MSESTVHVALDALGNVDTADHRPGRYIEVSNGVELIVYRASEFGGCRKRLIAYGLGLTPGTYPEWLLVKFAEGNKFEDEIIAHAMVVLEATTKVQQEVTELRLPGGIVVRSHTDAVAGNSKQLSGASCIIEAKAFAESTYKDWQKKGMAGFPHYAWQVSSYMLTLGLPCLFVVGLKDKTGRKIVDHDVTMFTVPPHSKLDFIKRAKAIETAIASGQLGDCGDEASYPCVFNFLHDDAEAADVVDLTADHDVKSFVNKWRMAKDMEKLNKSTLDALKVELAEIMQTRGHEKAVVTLDGKKHTLKHVTGTRSGYVVQDAAQDYWTIDLPRATAKAGATTTEGTTP